MNKLFILWDPKDGGFPRYSDDGKTFLSDGVLGRVGRDNAYLTAYPDMEEAKFPKGCTSLDDLQVGQCVANVKYSLSGSKGVYDIYRVQDTPALASSEYVDKGGCYCPVCGSEDMAGKAVQADAGYASQEIECQTCGATWEDVYKLDGYSDLSS